MQHQYNYNGGEKNSSKIKEKSFIFNHQQEKHNGEPANFKQSVLRSYKDCLSRQAAESVFISKMQGEILNSKSEFHQPPIVTVRREINRGLWLEISGVIAIYFLTFKLFISFGHKNLIYDSNSIFFFNVRQGPKDETCHVYNLYS